MPTSILHQVEYTLIHGNKGWQAQRVTGPGGTSQSFQRFRVLPCDRFSQLLTSFPPSENFTSSLTCSGVGVIGAPIPSDIPAKFSSKHGSTYRASSGLAPRYPYHSMRHSNTGGWGRDLIMTPRSEPEGIGYGESGFFGSPGGGGSQGMCCFDFFDASILF